MMKEEPYELDRARREHVLKGIQEACRRRGWDLIAAHVRMTQVHAIVSVDRAPEDVMIALKAYASRALNEAGFETKDRRRWAHHGSTRYLRDSDAIERAIEYVVDRQGAHMEVFSCDR